MKELLDEVKNAFFTFGVKCKVNEENGMYIIDGDDFNLIKMYFLHQYDNLESLKGDFNIYWNDKVTF